MGAGIQTVRDDIARILAEVERSLLGKPREVRLALACFLAGGHLLIEDVPGIGKTTLAHALANALGLPFRRVQFTADLLPADILGSSIFDRDTNRFVFHPGPVFTHCLLADEINRTTPKTQSALLEAMEEGQVTVEGDTRVLPDPFFVVATQNPSFHAGAYPLPESQLDRFLMRLTLGYPDARAERALLARGGRDASTLPAAVTDPESRARLRGSARSVRVTDALLDYVQAMLAATRERPEIAAGLSPRAGLSLLAATRAWALIQGRDFALPEDVQAVFVAVAGHRLHDREGRQGGMTIAQRLADEVAVP